MFCVFCGRKQKNLFLCSFGPAVWHSPFAAEPLPPEKAVTGLHEAPLLYIQNITITEKKKDNFMKLLEGKVALVTGASKGIGRSIALRYAQQGAAVAFTYLSSVEKGQALEDELKALGVNAKGYRSNAADFAAAEELVNAVVADFGKLDILVNNAGITRDNLLMRMTEQMWDEVINTNLKSCFNTVKAATRTFMKQKSGSIINITSVVGLKGNAGQSNYSASKAGIIGFTKSIALELGSRNIRSNAIAPGFIETEMTEVLDEKTVQGWRDAIPLRRGGQPEDVADCAVFLGSDMSAYISGQVLQVDGGMLT
jgi:3-oxoacyl-[acyl-carrier protein] reductase